MRLASARDMSGVSSPSRSRSRTCSTGEQRLDSHRVELCAGVRAQFLEGFLQRHAGAIGTVVRHRVEAVGDGEDAGAEWDLGAGQSARVAGAVPALVVGEHDLAGDLAEACLGHEGGADVGVPVHHLALLVSERPRLEEHLVGDADLANVVEQEAEDDLRVVGEQRIDRHAHRLAERGDPLDVTAGGLVAGVDGAGEGARGGEVTLLDRAEGLLQRRVGLLDCALGLLQVVSETAQLGDVGGGALQILPLSDAEQRRRQQERCEAEEPIGGPGRAEQSADATEDEEVGEQPPEVVAEHPRG